jgi:hypothetical protein
MLMRAFLDSILVSQNAIRGDGYYHDYVGAILNAMEQGGERRRRCNADDLHAIGSP